MKGVQTEMEVQLPFQAVGGVQSALSLLQPEDLFRSCF